MVITTIAILACREGWNKAASPKTLLQTAFVMARSPKRDDEGCSWEAHFSYHVQPDRLPRHPLGLVEIDVLEGMIQHRSPSQTRWITFLSTYSYSTGSLQKLASKPNQVGEVSRAGQCYYTHMILRISAPNHRLLLFKPKELLWTNYTHWSQSV